MNNFEYEIYLEEEADKRKRCAWIDNDNPDWFEEEDDADYEPTQALL